MTLETILRDTPERLNQANFLEICEYLAKETGSTPQIVKKEVLHNDILFALSNAGYLKNMNFHGGTSLRLIHGSPRYSEDLDFCGGSTYNSHNNQDLAECLQEYLGKRYGLNVSHKRKDMTNDNIPVDKWLIKVEVDPKHRNVPMEKVKIEVASVDYYTSEAQPLYRRYKFMPSGYGSMSVPTQKLNEILADKLISVVAAFAVEGRPRHLRQRDMFDINFIMSQGQKLDETVLDMFKRKIEDYNINNYMDRLNVFLQEAEQLLDELYLSTLQNQLDPRDFTKQFQQNAYQKHKDRLFENLSLASIYYTNEKILDQIKL